MITLLGSHSYMVEKDTHRICCWGEWAPRAVLTVATGAPLMLHTCSQVPAHVAMSPCETHSGIHRELGRLLQGYKDTTGYQSLSLHMAAPGTHFSTLYLPIHGSG